MCFEARLYNKTNKVFYIENVSRINIGGGKKILCTKFKYKLFFYQYCQELYTHATKLRVGAFQGNFRRHMELELVATFYLIS